MPCLKQVARDASLLRRHRREFADGCPQCPPDLSVDAPLVGVRGLPIHDPDSGADLRGRDEDLAQVWRVSGRGVDGNIGSTSSTSRSAMVAASGSNASQYPI
jgi:hypothetical protein